MDINIIIANNLKRLRKERNLSISQLAQLSGISKVMLSQIEKSEGNPTINTLWKIANGLKVPYTSLLDQQEHEATVIKKEDTNYQAVGSDHYRIYCYYPNTPSRNFELFQIELDEGHSYTSIGHSPRSKEYIMVLEGNLDLDTYEGSFNLGCNDAIEFIASEKHTYHSAGPGTLKAMIINYYPS